MHANKKFYCSNLQFFSVQNAYIFDSVAYAELATQGHLFKSPISERCYLKDGNIVFYNFPFVDLLFRCV